MPCVPLLLILKENEKCRILLDRSIQQSKFVVNSLTHSSSSFLEWNIRPRNNKRHSSRSNAFCSTPVQFVHPRSFRSASMVLLQVIFGLPRFLLPSGVQVSATLQLLSFSLLKNVTDPPPSSDFQSFRDGILSSSFIELTIRDGVRPKYAKDSSKAFSMENIQALHV